MSKTVHQLAELANPNHYRKAIFEKKKGKWIYPKVNEPLTAEIVDQHLSGKMPIGVGVATDGKTHFMVFDIDAKKGDGVDMAVLYRDQIALFLEEQNVPFFVCRSGGGYGFHIWIVFEHAVPIDHARKSMRNVLENASGNPIAEGKEGAGKRQIELRPETDDGDGGVIALPLARESRFLGRREVTASDGKTKIPVYDVEVDDIELVPWKPKRKQGGKVSKTPKTDEELIDEAWEYAQRAFSPDAYDTSDNRGWIECGLMLKAAADNDHGFRLWHEWSATGSGYESEADCRTKWDRYLKPKKYDAWSIFRIARGQGWKGDIGPLAALNETYAVIGDGSHVRIGREVYDPAAGRSKWVLHNQTDFMLMEYNDKDAKAWLAWKGRRTYPNGFTFDPTGSQHDGYLNLWKGWNVDPQEGDWSLIERHIFDVLAAGDKEHGRYIIYWLAWCVQNPDKQAEVALVLRGGKGVGKGMIGRAMCRIAGQHGLHISTSGQITGRFNSHMRDCIFLFADEAFWAGDKEGEGQLKRLVTEDTLSIEGKGRDIVQCRNMLHILIVSNEDWVVPATNDERRFAMFDVSDHRAGDHDYFKALAAQIDGGGLPAMVHDLLNMELGGWHPRRDIPKTAALHSQMQLSEDPLRALFREYLSTGELPGLTEGVHEPNECLPEVIMKALSQRPYGRGVKAAAIGRFLGLIPDVRKDTNGKVFDRWDGHGQVPIYKRATRYHLPPLAEVRQWFDAAEDWDDTPDWSIMEAEIPDDDDSPF